MGLWATLAREVNYIASIGRTLRRVGSIKVDGPDTVADILEHHARTTPDALAILFEGARYTYGDFERAANRYARFAMAQGVQRGEVVALLMENRPDFLFSWMGMAKIGAVSALINTNQTGVPLAHSLKISGAKHLILGCELVEAFRKVQDQMEPGLKVWVQGAVVDGFGDLDAALAAQDPSPLPPDLRAGMTTKDNLFYIYTSGTTGNPKAANFSHFRYLQMAHGFAAVTRATAADRIYLVLPLYHSAGGACGVGQVLTVGGSMVLKRRFSASQFWSDVQANDVTLFQYIGELCRYLLNAPPSAAEHGHKIRVFVGNGLRPDIWQTLKDRFQIPEIIEFYGATEGNVAMFNTDGKVGSIGRIPWYMDNIFKIKLVRFDVEAEAPLRDAQGFCIPCQPGEVGEAIGRINTNPKKGLGRFEGYRDAGATSKKILADVFEKGDAWFRSGDLMRRDAEGYFYFVDRIGDTFRWKGENVSTAEVAEVLSVFPGVKEVNVYGVKIADSEGRAGMAALVAENLDMRAFGAYAAQHLPDYAVPVFLRLRAEIEITGTFKHRKVDYVAEGFDPTVVREPVYFRDPADKRYHLVDPALHRRILDGDFKL